MSYQTSEGIIIKATPYRDYDVIFSVFSPESGKINLIKKGGASSLSPLTHVEFTYFIGKSNLYTCRSFSILNHHLSLRKNLMILETACEMLKAVQKILVPDQETALLFKQFLQCCQSLPRTTHPKTLLSWFYLSILQQEGLYDPSENQEIATLAMIENPYELQSISTSSHTLTEIKDLFSTCFC